MPKNKNKFFETFIGEYIEIVTSLTTEQTVETEEGIVSRVLPFYVYGYMLDDDDDFVYLGETPNNVSKVVSKKEIRVIGIHQEVDPMMEVLEEMPVPSDVKDIN